MTDKLMMIFNTYGLKNQKIKLIEEMHELEQAIINNDEANFIEEFADVQVLMDQIITTMNRSEINRIKKYKINRQIKRINGEV